MTRSIIFVLTAAFMFSINALANKELWKNAKKRNWEPVKNHLTQSPTAKQDLEWAKYGKVSVRGMLLGMQQEIKIQHPGLYEMLFSAEGLMPWKSKVEDPAVEHFIVTTNFRDFLDQHLAEDFEREALIEKWVQYHRRYLAYNFSPAELESMVANYLDPDFRLFYDGWEKHDPIYEQFVRPFNPLPDEKRVAAIKSLISVLELPGQTNDALVRIFSHRLDKASNEQILALAEIMSPAAFGEMTARIDLVKNLKAS